MSVFRHPSRFRRDQSGQVAVFFALLAVPLIAVTSASVDYTNVVREKQAIKGALDAAIIAAVNNNAIPLDQKGDFAKTHFNANYGGDVNLTLTPAVTDSEVYLSASGEIELSFGQLIGVQNPTVDNRSGGKIATEHTICVLALAEDADESISFGENVGFLAPDCTVHSNSKSATAVFTEQRTLPPKAKSFCAVGGAEGLFEPHAKGECRAIADPYENTEAARETLCISSYLYEIGEATSPIDLAMGFGDDIVDPFLREDVNLPVDPPVNTDVVMDHLEDIFGENHFDEGEGGRDGNDANHVEKVAEMGGDQLRKLLALYDAGDGHLHCDGRKKIPECDSFDHPFRDKDRDETPDREIVVEIFDYLFGSYYPDPADLPEILESEDISYINGKLYTKGNVDGELIHISKNLTGDSVRLAPGTYCGGLTVDGLSVHFAAGDYIFKDGPLTFLNGSSATAQNTTFAFMGENATLNVESESKLTIKAPSTGPRKGLAFMGIETEEGGIDSLPGQDVSRIASGGQISISGTAYLPQHTLHVEGQNSKIGAQSPAVGLIAHSVEFAGKKGSRVGIDIDHVKAGVPPIQPRAEDGARLIE